MSINLHTHIGPYALYTGKPVPDWDHIPEEQLVVRELSRDPDDPSKGKVTVLISNRVIPGLTQALDIDDSTESLVHEFDTIQMDIDKAKFYSFHKEILDKLESYKLCFGVLAWYW